MASVGPKSTLKAVKAAAKDTYQISAVGTKQQLLDRIAMAKLCCDGDAPLKFPSGDNPIRCKGADLKKQAAQLGCNVMGTADEILAEVITKLKANKPADPAPGDASSGGSKFASSNQVDPIALAKKVLELSEVDDSLGILNLGGAGITKDSPVAKMRKCYLKLSLVLHPDKNRGFDDATNAFQALVRAFERLTKPELFEEPSNTPSSKTIARSNSGCHVSCVKCPRCKVKWGAKVEGNPDYYFNFMMMGLRTFNCATCLIEFGCMTALHHCPGCNKEFEYSPEDYHRKITCGNKKCSKKFGFWMFHASDRVLKALRSELKEKQELYMKQVSQKKRRAESMRRRGALSSEQAEEAFVLGLSDACPRCGAELTEFDSEEEQRDHLRDCTDAKQHKAHAKKKKQQAEKAEELEAKHSAQGDVQAQAAWNFLGGAQEQMWMLTDGALETECKKAGIETKDDNKYEMMAKLGSTRPGSGASGNLSLTEGKTANKKSKRRKMTADSVPQNFQSMTMDQLKSVCAAHGCMYVLKYTSKADVIKAIEKEIYDEVAPMFLEAAKPSKKAKKNLDVEDDESTKTKPKPTTAAKAKKKKSQKKKKTDDEDEEDDDNDGSDSEWKDSDDEAIW
eukprot:m.126122 g.126122  ORF g.126122 m.126122 type:complete len:621 (-) comp29181_c0_seq1:145-2007(-)